MNKLAVLATLLLSTGCLESESEPTPTRSATASPQLERFADEQMPHDSSHRLQERRGDTDQDIDLCTQVVETEGACAVACEPEKLLAFIPDGTCALFICTLEDGREYRTGGCDW